MLVPEAITGNEMPRRCLRKELENVGARKVYASDFIVEEHPQGGQRDRVAICAISGVCRYSSIISKNGEIAVTLGDCHEDKGLFSRARAVLEDVANSIDPDRAT